MRGIIAVLIVLGLALSAHRTHAQDYSELLRNFSANTLTTDDKRFLQAALAFEGHYNGLLDGDWGPLSQRAMYAYARKNFGKAATDWHQAFLAFSYFQRVSEDGWKIRFIDSLGLSFLVPASAVTVDEPSDTFVNFRHKNSSLSYSVTTADLDRTQRLHDFTERFNDVYEPPYIVRKPDFAVTSNRNRKGKTLDTRSNFVAGSWSTIMLSAESSDGNLLGAVTSSISTGNARPLSFTKDGDLDRAIVQVLAVLDNADKAEPEPSVGSGNPQVATRENTSQFSKIETEPPLHENEPSAGTGFIVSETGHVLTNAHVVEGCGEVLINDFPADLLASSDTFDLALLQGRIGKLQTYARFANGPSKLNADVTVAGFPYAGLLGGLNITRGAVSSLKGLGGNALQMQITAPVQSGNSGGPVIASNGSVVGIVVSKLDAALVADALGDVPQNVNFAVRGEIAKLFLSQHGVQPALDVDGSRLEPTELADAAAAYTVFIACE